jgi:hypothetical protein
MKQKFEAKLTSRGPGGAWTFLYIPFSVEEAFCSKGRVAVSGTMNGFPFRNSLLLIGDGTHRMAVSKDTQMGAKAAAGDTVTVTMELDRAERTVVVPEALEMAFKKNKKAAEFFCFAELLAQEGLYRLDRWRKTGCNARKPCRQSH